MTHLKKIDEILGINDIFRNFTYSGEADAKEIEAYIKKKKILNLTSRELKRGDKVIKKFEFIIPNYDHDLIEVQFINSLPPLKLPGTTDYRILVNSEELRCSRYVSKLIYNLITNYSLNKGR